MSAINNIFMTPRDQNDRRNNIRSYTNMECIFIFYNKIYICTPAVRWKNSSTIIFASCARVTPIVRSTGVVASFMIQVGESLWNNKRLSCTKDDTVMLTNLCVRKFETGVWEGHIYIVHLYISIDHV